MDVQLFELVEKAKQEWEASVDAIAEGLALYEMECLSIVRGNWTMARLFYMDHPSQLVGKDLHTLLCGCNQRDCKVLWFLKSSHSTPLEIERSDRNQIWLFSSYPIHYRDKTMARKVLLLRDVTHERAWQKKTIEAEQKNNLLKVAGSIAQQIIPAVSLSQYNLNRLLEYHDRLRDGVLDYRIALGSNGSSKTSFPSTSWKNIEEQHNLESMLFEISQLLNQSIANLEQIQVVVNDISKLKTSPISIQNRNIHTLIESVLDLISEEHEGRVLVDRHYSSLPLISCDPLRLKSAIIGMIVYLIKTSAVTNHISIFTRLLGSQINVVIRDVTAIQDPRTMEVLQTTELVDETKWLEMPGLSSAYQIIRDHGGRMKIECQSNMVIGITTWLPVAT